MKRRKPTPKNLRQTGVLVELGEELPTEFRIFKAGRNTTANGYDVVFDEQAAAWTMAAFEKHGVDLMIDLAHLSNDKGSINYDPDARGWFKLAVRNGELWAVDVRWTEDGAERLQSKKQRYVSPTFWTDKEDRLVDVAKIALLADPGTDHAMPLMAASRETRVEAEMKLTLSTIKSEGRKLLGIISARGFAKTLAEGEGEGQVGGVDIAELAAFLEVQAAPASDPAGFIAELKAKLSEILGKLDGTAAAPEAPVEDMPEAAQAVAANRILRKMLGASTDDDAVVTLAGWKQLALEHQERLAKLAKDEKVLDDTKRRQLTARLVVCRAETPSTAWQDDAKTIPAKHLQAMSLEALEQRAKDFEATSGTRAPITPASAAPTGTQMLTLSNGKTAWLDAGELKAAAQMNCEPAKFAQLKYPNGRTA